MNSVNGLFIDPEGLHQLEKIYADHTGSWKTVADVFRECKRRIMNELFPGELKAMVLDLARLAESDHHARDLWTEDLKEALVSVTACLRVYRTYIRDQEVSETDRAYIEDAVNAAVFEPAGAVRVHQHIGRVLTSEVASLQQHGAAEAIEQT